MCCKRLRLLIRDEEAIQYPFPFVYAASDGFGKDDIVLRFAALVSWERLGAGAVYAWEARMSKQDISMGSMG